MKTRIKTHQMPGDISKYDKQEMLEKGEIKHPNPFRARNRKVSKTFKKAILSRERAVLKERTKKLIDEQLDDFEEVGER